MEQPGPILSGRWEPHEAEERWQLSESQPDFQAQEAHRGQCSQRWPSIGMPELWWYDLQYQERALFFGKGSHQETEALQTIQLRFNKTLHNFSFCRNLYRGIWLLHLCSSFGKISWHVRKQKNLPGKLGWVAAIRIYGHPTNGSS